MTHELSEESVTASPVTGAPDSILQQPMLRRLIAANGTILVLTVAVAGGVLPRVPAASGRLAVEITLIGVAILTSLIATGAVLRSALKPLREVEASARSIADTGVGAGSSGARSELGRMATTWNDALRTAAERNRDMRDMVTRNSNRTEEEKRRLATELHDGIAQSLAALNIQVKLARGATSSEVREGVLDEVSAGLAGAILELRRMARGLRPPALEVLGLAASVETHARAAAEAAGLTAEIRAESVAGLLSGDVELALYRILQESIANVVRHASANRMTIDLGRRGSLVHLVVEDDGRGFDPRFSGDGRRCLGLFSMREQCESLGGRFHVDSEIGRGSRIAASFPVTERANG